MRRALPVPSVLAMSHITAVDPAPAGSARPELVDEVELHTTINDFDIQ